MLSSYTSILLSILDKKWSIILRREEASVRQSFSSSTIHFLNIKLAYCIYAFPMNLRVTSNSGLSKYHRRRIGDPETINHKSLPRQNTSNDDLISSTRIPIAQAGIQSRLPTFSTVPEILVWLSSVKNTRPKSPRIRLYAASKKTFCGLISRLRSPRRPLVAAQNDVRVLEHLCSRVQRYLCLAQKLLGWPTP